MEKGGEVASRSLTLRLREYETVAIQLYSDKSTSRVNRHDVPKGTVIVRSHPEKASIGGYIRDPPYPFDFS